MLKPFSMIFFILVMVWTGAIFLTSNAATRIERACVPTTVADKIVVAVVQLVYEPWAIDAHQAMLNLEYGCKFTVWKTFYEDVLERTGAEAPTAKNSTGSKKAEPTSTVVAPKESSGKQAPTPAPTPAAPEELQKAEEKKPLINYMDAK